MLRVARRRLLTTFRPMQLMYNRRYQFTTLRFMAELENLKKRLLEEELEGSRSLWDSYISTKKEDESLEGILEVLEDVPRKSFCGKLLDLPFFH